MNRNKEGCLNRIREKLQSQSGVSILFSLVIFMVATIVCITIIVAANTAVKMTHDNKEFTQTSLALDSAASLLKDQMTGMKFTYVTVSKDGKAIGTAEVSVTDGTFSEEIKSAGYFITENMQGDKEFTISTNKDMKDVNVSYVIKDNSDDDTSAYKIIYTLSADSTNEKIYISFIIRTSAVSSEEITADDNGNEIKTVKSTATYEWIFDQISGTAGVK